MIELLRSWLPRQRWYATKHLTPQLEIAELADEGDHFQVAFVRDTAPAAPLLYQIPLGIGPQPPEGVPVIGKVGDHWLWDAAGDPEFIGLRLGFGEPKHVRVLSGEQSNTSVICELADGPVISKLFRVLTDGVNPDVELTQALTLAGCAHVAAFASATFGRFPGGNGHLQVTNEFIPDAPDAWRVALESAREGAPFAARELGATVREIHTLLEREFGGTDAEPDDVMAGWRARAATALTTVRELRPHEAAIARVYDAAGRATWPSLQRIHGDLHLGQVIDSERGWIVLDFEGEPLRPLSERRRPDVALRDVAGMLRSFDYAQVASGSTDPEWSRNARADFLAGYGAIAAESAPILTALELDKALYEAVYEATSRPDWLHVPLAGITRIFDGLD